ncbi:hypothetical protein BH10PLA2_BH10PLA2_00820 [soil metagenome]
MTFDIEIAARTVRMEAEGEGENGMKAVAWAIINRHDAGQWFSGKTLTECCLMAEQFSCWNTRDPNRIRMARWHDDDPLLDLCRSYVHTAMLNVGDDPTLGATHYCNLGICKPKWAVAEHKTIQIGHHTFFKNLA